MPQSARDYVLGTHDEELDRLGLQHSLWRDRAIELWKRAGFGAGNAILDVGCGPGFGTADLSEIVGTSGRVVGVDLSEKFVSRVRSLNLPNVDVRLADVQQLDSQTVGHDSFDGAYARWVLCFVPEPQRVLDGVARLLKPGGRFAIQDYYNYASIKLAPESKAFERVVRAVDESFRVRGGDPNVGCRLPAMLDRAGFKVTHLAPILRLGKPTDPLWKWPDSFFRIYLPTLVEMKLITTEDSAAFLRDWDERSNDPHAFFTSPPMVEIIAEKV